jgi:hypothetical protein
MNTAKALVRSGVQYTAGDARAPAPTGEYAVERTADGAVRFESAAAGAFTLSFDSFSRHVLEGRIALVGGSRQ